MSVRSRIAAGFAVVAVALAGCTVEEMERLEEAISGAAPESTEAQQEPGGTADDGPSPEHSLLEVAEYGAPVEYQREEQFGRSWSYDFDGNGCDARNDILQRDLDDLDIDFDDCTVLSGTLLDPFTGEVIEFERGQGTSMAVQIDHIVPLSWAWHMGAYEWDEQKRLEFANDPVNLIAVDGPSNGSKGDSGPGDWLPPNEEYRCAYVDSFVNVLVEYDLPINEYDLKAVESVRSEC